MDAWLCVPDTQLPLKGVAFRPDVSLLVTSCIVCLQLLRPKWDSFNSSNLTFEGQQSSGRKTPRPLPSRRLSMCTHCQTLGDSADFVRRRRLCRSSSGGCRWTSLSALARTPARTTRTCRRRRSGSVARSCGRRHLSPSSATSHYLSMASCRVCVNEFRTSTLCMTPAQVTSTSAIEPSSCTPPCTTATWRRRLWTSTYRPTPSPKAPSARATRRRAWATSSWRTGLLALLQNSAAE